MGEDRAHSIPMKAAIPKPKMMAPDILFTQVRPAGPRRDVSRLVAVARMSHQVEEPMNTPNTISAADG